MYSRCEVRWGEIEDHDCQGHSACKEDGASQHTRDEVMFPEIVECVKGVEVLESAQISVNTGETRRRVGSARSFSESVESSEKKKPRISKPEIQGQQDLKPPPHFRAPGVLLKHLIVCYRCRQSGHVRSRCPWRGGSCYTCGELGHMARNCPRESGVHGESSSVEQHECTQKQQSSPVAKPLPSTL